MKNSTSVVIVTYNRPKELEETVRSLLNQSIEPYEIIIIDDSSCPPLTGNFAFKNLKMLRFDHEIGVSAARNYGMKIAEGECVAFLDDDAVAEVNWLEEVQKGFDAGADIVGGPIEPIFKASPPRWWDEKNFSHYLSIKNAPNKYVDYPSGIWSCNMALRKKMLERVGNFNTSVGRQGGKLLAREDVDLVNRAKEKGCQILFLPNAIVYHKVSSDRMTIPYVLRWEYYVGKTSRILYGYHPLKAFLQLYKSAFSLILSVFMGSSSKIRAMARVVNSLGQL